MGRNYRSSRYIFFKNVNLNRIMYGLITITHSSSMLCHCQTLFRFFIVNEATPIEGAPGYFCPGPKDSLYSHLERGHHRVKAMQKLVIYLLLVLFCYDINHALWDIHIYFHFKNFYLEQGGYKIQSPGYIYIYFFLNLNLRGIMYGLLQ